MNYKKIYKKVEARYIIIAILLVLLFVSRQIMIQRQINIGRDMSTLINVSGRQRMLSQKIAKDSVIIYENPEPDIMAFYLEELELSLNLFDQSHKYLTNENHDPSLVAAYDEIEPFFIKILEAGHDILESIKQDGYKQEQIVENIKTITLSERIFLEKMDKIVLRYDQAAEGNIIHIEKLENIVFYLIIAAILFITLFIFIPASKTLKYAFVEISENNENIMKMFYSMKGILFLVNKDGKIINYNASALEIMTIAEAEIERATIETAVNWLDTNIKDTTNRVLFGEEFNGVEVKIQDKSGLISTYLLFITKGMYQEKAVFLISAYDITSQKKAEEILKKLAITDKLTELYNRHFLESVIASKIEESIRDQYPISVAMLDIDNFKAINDKWGHPVGDLVLQEIAKIIRDNIRESDHGIRVGGEEFIILMPHTNQEGAYRLAEKIRKAIENNINPIVGAYTASFGVAQIRKGENYPDLYDRVDDALYNAKSSGKNCVVKSIPDSF